MSNNIRNLIQKRAIIVLIISCLSICLFQIPVLANETSSDMTDDFEIDTEGTLIKYHGKDTKVTVPDGVVRIGDHAFAHCSELVEIKLPNGITSIGNNAFYCCSDLKDINLPDSLLHIEEEAFSACGNLEVIEIPDGVISIGDRVFTSCYNLKSIDVSETNKEFCSKNGILFSKNMKELLLYPAQKNGESYLVPDTITTIRYGAFSRCENLKEIKLPNGVSNIENYAFSGCSNLEEIIIPESVISMEGNGIFSGCNSLKNVKLPTSITSIGNTAFTGCTSLTSIDIPTGVKTIGYEAFQGCSGLKDIVLPNNLTSIGWGGFYGCSSLENIKIPDGMTVIGGYAFLHCSSLKTVELPDTIEEIWYSFAHCTNLTRINIPRSVTLIMDSAFDECEKLVIYGEENSYAQTFAIEKGIPFSVITNETDYNITYQLNGGTDNNNNPKTYTEGTEVSLHSPTRIGFTFSGWYTDANFKNKISKVTKDTTGNLTLHAKWSANSYKIAFDKNGGNKLSSYSKNVTYNTAYGNLPTATRKGYAFAGWYTSKKDGSKITKSTKVTITNNQTLYAQWEKISTPKTAKISSVKNKNPKQMTVKLKKTSGADGYQILYSTKSTFKSSKKTTSASTNKTIKKLKKGKTYYVKVRAYKLDSTKKKIYGKYSSVKQVKITK